MTMLIFAGFATFFAGLLTAAICFANGMRSSPGEFIGRNFIALAWMVVCVLWLIATWPAKAEEHNGHRPQDMELHHKFYKTWMMPDNRAISCCHDEDCKPAEAKQIDGKWYARQEGDQGNFTPIPAHKIEQERDTPDGRNHLCGRRYGFNTGDFTVFCFIFGNGG
jgi:hypothetical protein